MKKAAFLTISLVLIICFVSPAESKCKGKRLIKKGNVLYFDQKFDEALDCFLKAYEKGCQDGVTQYKIFYCSMKTGDEEKEKSFLASAISTLEQESNDTPELETFFYLANAYFSSKKGKEGLEASKRAIKLNEEGKFGSPAKSLPNFQLGKIHLDGGERQKARQFYRKAYELSLKKRDLPVTYVKMILSEIAFSDYKEKHYVKALEGFNHLLEVAGEIYKQDSKYQHIFSHMAVSSINTGDYEGAERAWKKVIELGLPYSEEAQYKHRIARAALEVSALWSDIEIIPEDREAKKLMKDEKKFRQFKHDFMVRNFKEMNNDALEEKIIELSKKAKELKSQDPSLSGEEETQGLEKKKSLNKKLEETKRSFVFALVEYIGRDFLIREKALKNGFAVQVMRKDAWVIR
jgi:tetratricopeptide (TPR) repeat protein